MNKKEFATIVAFLEGVYKDFHISGNKVSMEMWFECLRDLDYSATQAGLKKHIMTSKWQPTIAEIRKSVADITNPAILSNTEAWGEVTKAIKKFGSWDQDRALNSLSTHTRTTVESFGWDRLCGAENVDVVRGQFLKMYDSFTIREKEKALLPEDFKVLIENTVRRI